MSHLPSPFLTPLLILLLTTPPAFSQQRPSILKKTSSPHSKSVSFDLSSISNLVTEQSTNHLFQTLHSELPTNPSLFKEYLNGLLSGFSRKPTTILHNSKCISYLQASYFNKMDKLHDETTQVFLDDLSMSDRHNADKRYDICLEDKQGVINYLQERLNFYITQIEVLQSEIEEMKMNGYDKAFYMDKEFEIEMYEFEIARSEIQVKTYELFPCKGWAKGNDAFVPVPLATRYEVAIRSLGKFCECYEGDDKDILDVIKEVKGRGQSLMKAAPMLYSLIAKKYKFRVLGKKLEGGNIEEFLSKAQVAEGKIVKEVEMMRKKYPHMKEGEILGMVDFKYKRDVVFYVGMAFGDIARKVFDL